MSRKKLNIYIVSAILVLYVLSLVIAYGLAAQYVENDFHQNLNGVTSAFENKYTHTDNTGAGVSLESIVSEFSRDTDHTYPWQAAFLDTDGNIVAKTGSWVEIVPQYICINLDPYLTEEHWELIFDYAQMVDTNISSYSTDYSGTMVYAIECYKDEDTLIPIKFYFTNEGETEEFLELQLSDYEANYYYYYGYPDPESSTRKYYMPEYIEKIPFQERAAIDAYFTDGDANGADHDIYQSLLEELNEKNIKNDLWAKTYHDHAYMDGNKYFYSNQIQVQGKYYTMYLAGEYSEFREVPQSMVFKNAVLMQTILFLVTGIGLLIAVNYLYKKNQNLEISRQMFTSAVAHELKTPVAIIQNQCECVLEDVAPEKNKEYVKSVYDEAIYMSRMIQSFLQYSRLQTVRNIEKEKHNLRDIVIEELQKYEDLLDAANLDVIVELDEDAECKVNKELISLVIDNFLSNAYKYTAENYKVKVSLKKEKSGYGFSVFNEGATIEEAFEKSMWDVLSRQDQARNRKMKSSGMGLPICKQILELHGFEYGCETNGEGVTFYFICK